jgi:peroxiredoxin
MNLLIALTLSLGAATLFAQEPKPAPAPTPAPAPAPAADGTKPAAPKTLELGQRVEGSIELPDIDGTLQKAHDLLGKVVVVNFFSIQCPIQAQWDGRLAAIQKDFEAQGVVFLHIDSNVTEIGEAPPKAEGDAKPYDNVRQHLAARQLPFRVLVDHGNRVADVFAATSTPHVYVFGKDGKLAYKGLVDDDQRDKNPEGRKNHLRDVLGTMLIGKVVTPYATKEIGCSIKRLGAGKRGGGKARGEKQ